MSLASLSDESLLIFYEGVRKEVEADREARSRGGTYFFTNSDAIKEYAANLQQEMDRRQLSYSPIVWL